PTTGIEIHQLVHAESNGQLLRTAHQADRSLSRPESDRQAGAAENLPQLQTAWFDTPLLQGQLYWGCHWRVAIPGPAVAQRCHAPLLPFSLARFQQKHQASVIAQ